MKIFLFILLTFTAIPAIACDCDYAGDFMTVGKTSPLIAHVKVKRFFDSVAYDNSHNVISPKDLPAMFPNEIHWVATLMEVEVIEIFKGRKIRKRLVIRNTDGNDCRASFNYFKKDSSYVIAFYVRERNPNIGIMQFQIAANTGFK